MKAKSGFGREAARAAAGPVVPHRKPRARAAKKQRRSWCRWPEQRDALAYLGITASQLRDWLQCEYLRARGLRGGNLMLTGRELSIIQAHSPVGGAELARRIALSENDVRLRQLALPMEGAK